MCMDSDFSSDCNSDCNRDDRLSITTNDFDCESCQEIAGTACHTSRSLSISSVHHFSMLTIESSGTVEKK